MIRRLIRVTSPGHPQAVIADLGGAFIGVANILGLAEAKGMRDMIGADGVSIWAAVACLSGLLAASVALISRFDEPSESRLRIEWVSLIILFLCYLWYEITLVASNGSGVLITQVLAVSIFLGAAWRAIEIIFEVRRIRDEPKVGA